MQGVISNFHFQAVQGTLLREKKEPSGYDMWQVEAVGFDWGFLWVLVLRAFFAEMSATDPPWYLAVMGEGIFGCAATHKDHS